MSRRLALLCVLICLVLLPARAARASDDFLPAAPQGMVKWSKAPLYDRYPVWNYTYGGVKTFPETIGRLYYLVNLMQVGKAWTVKLGLRSVEYALYFDAVSPVVDAAGRSLSAIGRLTTDDAGGWLVRSGLALTGAMALWYWALKGRRTKALRVLAGGAVLLVGTYVVVAAAPGFLIASAGAARGLGVELVGGVAAVAAPAGAEGSASERLVRAAGEGAWRALVLDPWVEGEFSAGAVQKPAYNDGEIQGGKWLEMSPTARENWYLSRLDFATRLSDFHQYDERMVQDYLPRRFFLALVSLLLGLVWALALLLLAGGVLYYQFVLLAMLALAPLWAVLGLWHPAGVRVARGAIMKAAGALISQVVLLAVLALLLGLTGPLLSLGAPLGWLAQGLMITLFAAVLSRYRFAWLRWGREEGAPGVIREIRSWRERFRLQRVPVTSPAAGPAAVQEALTAAGMPLPQFREAASGSAPPVEVAGRRRAESPEPAVHQELTEEFRRLRVWVGRESETARAPRAEREAAVRPGAPEAKGSAPAGPAVAPPPRIRTEVGRVLNEFRRRK